MSQAGAQGAGYMGVGGAKQDPTLLSPTVSQSLSTGKPVVLPCPGLGCGRAFEASNLNSWGWPKACLIKQGSSKCRQNMEVAHII